MKKIYLFPGQGSQKIGMGEGLFDTFSKETNTANEVLGYSIKDLCLNDPNGVLNQTEYTQPALFVVNALSFLALNQSDAVAFAGHSLGEYNALFAAGVFDFETGVKLVQKRGALMSEAKGGGMAAVIGITPDHIKETLESEGLSGIDIANYNSPLQTVISGPKQDIDQSIEPIKAAGARLVVPLKVSAAFHSRYMKEAAEEFGAFLDHFTFHAPTHPVISNYSATEYSADSIKVNLSRQIDHSVRWVETITQLNLANDISFEEVGPGKVLAGLLKQIIK